MNKYEKQRLLDLYWKVVENKATVPDYYEYEYILLQNGYSKERIKNELGASGYQNWEQFYTARNPPKPQKSNVDTIVVGVIAGLAVAILLNKLLKD